MSVGVCHGAAIVGRPVSKELDSAAVAEITRLVTDGCYNGCSKLYGACARVTKEMGFAKVQTYILEDEPGTSLKAAGFQFEYMTKGGNWASSERYKKQGRRQDQPQGPKQLWSRVFIPDQEIVVRRLKE